MERIYIYIFIHTTTPWVIRGQIHSSIDVGQRRQRDVITISIKRTHKKISFASLDLIFLCVFFGHTQNWIYFYNFWKFSPLFLRKNEKYFLHHQHYRDESLIDFFLCALLLIDRDRGVIFFSPRRANKKCAKAFFAFFPFFASHYYRFVDPSWRQARKKNFNLLFFSLFRPLTHIVVVDKGMCFDCKLPFSTLSLIIIVHCCCCRWLDILSSQVCDEVKGEKGRHDEMAERACVYAITCRLIIFFLDIATRTMVRPHMLFRWLHFCFSNIIRYRILIFLHLVVVAEACVLAKLRAIDLIQFVTMMAMRLIR